ncbi:MAG: HTTM domain-containing protein [Myxococcota bacterium]
MNERLRQLLTAERPVYLLGLLRVALAGFVLLGTVNAIRETSDQGYFGDVFHIPLLPEQAVPSRSVYLGLLVGRALAASLALVGVLARPSLLVAALIGLYCMACDRLQYHNNRYVLELLTFLLAFARCDRSLRWGVNEPDARGPWWPSWLMKVQISLVYIGSAGSKLVDFDWRGGQVLHIRYLRVLEVAAERGKELPAWVHSALSSPLFAELTSKAAIFGELFLAIGLWLPRTRALALWLGVLLHFGIQVAARVEIFSFLMGAAYLLFSQPELRERKLYLGPASQLWGRIVRRLDWLRRFEIIEQPGEFAAADRGGEPQRGLGAWVVLARALPLLFPLWLPLKLVARFARRAATLAPPQRA